MDQAQKSIIERLNQANNILVTVSNNPTVDQLSACVGFTLLLNKLDKHATAVFSGAVPPALEFLQPEKTIEKNTDSLRDFIIALDKSKADKLKYKVEDKVVKIFITPYRTSISETDLDFSQGDFNVDVVVALGVHERKDLDEAITAHGRILHDATVICVNLDSAGNLGSINLTNPDSSSLSEILVGLGTELKADIFDEQIANAFLTGIVAETDRFSNEKTSSATMGISAKLMAAGANQQLVVNKLETALQATPEPSQAQSEAPTSDKEEPAPAPEATASSDGSLQIDHYQNEDTPSSDVPTDKPSEPNVPAPEPPNPAEQASSASESPQPVELPEPENSSPSSESDQPQAGLSGGPHVLTEPPSMGGTLTANGRPEALDPVTDPLSVPAHEFPLLSHDADKDKDHKPAQPSGDQAPDVQLPPMEPSDSPSAKNAMLKNSQLEAVPQTETTKPDNSEPSEQANESGSKPPTPEEARRIVEEAMKATAQPPLESLDTLNAQAADINIEHGDSKVLSDAPPLDAALKPPTSNINVDPHTGEIMFPDESGQDDQSPPPVPPPMMPPPPPTDQDT